MSDAPQKDLMQTLLTEFQAAMAESPAEAWSKNIEPDRVDQDAALEGFVEWCRERLAKNGPVSMEYIDQGFAIRFQDSSVVPFCTHGEAQAGTTGGIQGGVPVSQPSPQDAARGIDQKNSYAFPVTGKPDEQS